MSLDLHGYTVHNAWHKFNEHVRDCYQSGKKKTIVITGHGQIGNELIAWVHNNQYTEHCERLDPNTGAYRIKIRKNKAQSIKVQQQPVDLTGLYKKFNKN